MKKSIITLTLLSFVAFCFAQGNFTLKGKVILQDGYLPAGNIMALHPKDSTLIKGDFFLDGIFELTDLNQEAIILQFSSLEFEDIFLAVAFNNKEVLDLGEITVNNTGVALDEIVVKSRRAIYKQHLDGTLEVLIENTALAASNSINEILTKTPNVLADENGQLSVFGKGNAILYLNGKRITNNQLTLIAPSNIKKIEIIRNPSAKYDADGAAVIHIQTIQKADNGYQVNLQQNATYSPFGGANSYSSLTFNQKMDQFTSNGFYSLLKGKNKERLHTTRSRPAEALFLNTDVTTDWQREFDNFSTYGLGLQLDGQQQNYISLEYSGFSEQLGGQQFSHNQIEDNFGINYYDSDIARDEKETSNTFSLNYHQPIDTLGSTIFVGGQLANFTSTSDNLIKEKSTGDTENSERLLKNIFDLNIDIYSGQFDFTKVFSNKSTLEVGSKYSFVEDGSTLDFLVATDGLNFQLDPTFSNVFQYQESIAASYFSFKGQTKSQLQYTFGLRSEWTKYDLYVSDQIGLIEDKYLNLFPSFSIGKRLVNGNQLNFAYTSSINRPSYQNLSPVLIYQDPYTSIQGNPNLIPEKNHAFELSAQLNKTNFSVGYNHSIDPLGARAIRGNTLKSYILLPVNYQQRQQFFTAVSRTIDTKWWTSRNTLNLRYTDIKESVLDAKRVTPRPNLYFYTNNTFNVADLFKIDLIFWYLGDQYTGITHRQQRHNLSITLEKSFFDNALKCRLMANDLLKGTAAEGNYEVGETAIYYNRQFSNNYFRFSVLYNFGRLKKAGFKNKSIGASESSRVR